MRRVRQTLSPTRRLTILYITALSTVALLTLLGQAVIQSALQHQSSDALVINIAGRQRMLSQRLSKSALALEVFSDAKMRQQNADELRDVVALWRRCQEGLQHGDAALGLPGNNSETVKRLFAAIEPNYRAMLQASKGLLALALPDNSHTSATPASAFLPFIQTILAAQSGFLIGMDHIVSQYQREAEEHVAQLKYIEFTLLGLTLLVLLLEGLFVFRPAVQRLRQTIADLIQANERAARAEVTRKRAERILALNEALAASQKNNPHARIVAFGHYQVRDKEGNYHNVYHREVGGQQVFVCECLQYQEHMICSHSLAAAALHSVSGLQPN
jgi:nitrate/nitrite-specific signal transduction histidine kinase